MHLLCQYLTLMSFNDESRSFKDFHYQKNHSTLAFARWDPKESVPKIKAKKGLSRSMKQVEKKRSIFLFSFSFPQTSNVLQKLLRRLKWRLSKMPTIRNLEEIPTSEDVGLDTLEAPSSLHILSDVSRNDTSLDEHLERDQLGNTINSQMTYTLRPTIIIYPTGMLGVWKSLKESHLNVRIWNFSLSFNYWPVW